MTYNRKYIVKLSEVEKTSLEGLLNKGTIKSRVSKRIISLLHLSEGKTYKEVSHISLLSSVSLNRLAQEYQTAGIHCIYDKSRPGRPIVISEAQADKITTLALEDAPEGHSQWSLRLLADKVVELGHCEHISHTAVGKILKKRNFNPI